MKNFIINFGFPNILQFIFMIVIIIALISNVIDKNTYFILLTISYYGTLILNRINKER